MGCDAALSSAHWHQHRQGLLNPSSHQRAHSSSRCQGCWANTTALRVLVSWKTSPLQDPPFGTPRRSSRKKTRGLLSLPRCFTAPLMLAVPSFFRLLPVLGYLLFSLSRPPPPRAAQRHPPALNNSSHGFCDCLGGHHFCHCCSC